MGRGARLNSVKIQFKHNVAKFLRLTLAITFVLELFYIIGYYVGDWPWPTPTAILQFFLVVCLGAGLGTAFAKVWPLPPHKGWERIMRTLLISIPALGIGIGLQTMIIPLFFSKQPDQAIFMIFTVSAWLGSGFIVRQEE